MLWRHVKVVISVITAGEGVEASSVLAQELAVFVLVRKLLRPEEEHVLAEVGQAGQVGGVGETANLNIQSGGGQVGRLV